MIGVLLHVDVVGVVGGNDNIVAVEVLYYPIAF